MTKKNIEIGNIPAVLYGEASDRLWLFVHGRCGCKEEALAFAEIVCPDGWQVLSADLPEHGARKSEKGFDPWHVVPELGKIMELAVQRASRIRLRANSIGAWFSMQAFSAAPPELALLVSPVLDMEKLITGMMLASGVDEKRLEREGIIETTFGEPLSWEYLQYVRAHPVTWNVPTEILYAGKDSMTSRDTVDEFAGRFGCHLTVMENGEHWFHTPEQLAVLQRWERAAALR